ncbi:hypothetical protein LXL04_007959 [Taraxacum kok-saghyz]
MPTSSLTCFLKGLQLRVGMGSSLCLKPRLTVIAFGCRATTVIKYLSVFVLRPGLDQLRRPGIVRSSSPIHPNHIALDNTAEAGCWVRSQVRVSPTTCLRGIVQGDMVGVYWAARPYDAGPSEVRSQVRVSPTTCLRGIVQGDMVGVYWAARPYDAGPSEVRSQVRVSPTTCLRGIVQGDMVGVYWAARPYDAGPSELVQPGS